MNKITNDFVVTSKLYPQVLHKNLIVLVFCFQQRNNNDNNNNNNNNMH